MTRSSHPGTCAPAGVGAWHCPLALQPGPNGKQVAVSIDAKPKVVSLRDLYEQHRLTFDTGQVSAVRYSPDGTLVLVAADFPAAKVSVIDVETGNITHSFPVPERRRP